MFVSINWNDFVFFTWQSQFELKIFVFFPPFLNFECLQHWTWIFSMHELYLIVKIKFKADFFSICKLFLLNLWICPFYRKADLYTYTWHWSGVAGITVAIISIQAWCQPVWWWLSLIIHPVIDQFEKYCTVKENWNLMGS